ncbi:AraC family transcriptional regulator [Bdellovibrio sp. NC01]|uniref:AraC family transcriptional regulator n=1 Tax=Bdellovibrio sp. NC01 TaxID=2220073 RepID=UPI0011596D77|nr:AraC family transcriptional regulator [Bdellovibrio sp. NC01]QDK39366.1 AraC family transcriptional regulator [Bdellovibrio sp. NC01]
MESDTLSDVLMKMRLKSSAAGILDTAGKWVVENSTFGGFKLQVVLKGDRYFVGDGKSKAIHVKAGDCVLLTGKKPLIIGSDLDAKKRIRMEDLHKTKTGGVMTINGGGEMLSIGTHFEFEGHLPKVLFEGLPTWIHVDGNSDQAAVLRWSVERFKAEFFGKNPGRGLILNHLTPIMLLQILRIYLETSNKKQQNWLFAISDPQLSKVFDKMHSQYQEPWSLESLAEVAGLSRSGFALAFKKKVGISPLDYLTNWRMQIACDLLRTEGQNVSSVAEAIGYESESAFSVAFKRVIKCRPGQYQRQSVLK